MGREVTWSSRSGSIHGVVVVGGGGCRTAGWVVNQKHIIKSINQSSDIYMAQIQNL